MKHFEIMMGGYYRYRDVPTGNAVDITIRYDAGGPSMNGESRKKGIYVHVTPVVLEEHANGTTAIYKVYAGLKGSGFKMLVLSLTRKNQAAITKVAELLDDVAPAIAEAFKNGSPPDAFNKINHALNAIII